jgi:hypothetical protein
MKISIKKVGLAIIDAKPTFYLYMQQLILYPKDNKIFKIIAYWA